MSTQLVKSSALYLSNRKNPVKYELKMIEGDVDALENKLQEHVMLIDTLGDSCNKNVVTSIIPFVTFSCTIKWYKYIEGVNRNLGFKEVGASIRLAAVKALGKLRDKRALSVLEKALHDKGDMNREITSLHLHYYYTNGDDIRREAQKSIKKIRQAISPRGVVHKIQNISQGYYGN